MIFGSPVYTKGCPHVAAYLPHLRQLVAAAGVLPAVEDAHDGVIQGGDGNRSFRATFVVMVAPWSARCRSARVYGTGFVVMVTPDRGGARTRPVLVSGRAAAAIASG
jgi:hypothetical protein